MAELCQNDASSYHEIVTIGAAKDFAPTIRKVHPNKKFDKRFTSIAVITLEGNCAPCK